MSATKPQSIKVIKKADVIERDRSELTLLYQLIKRNPERAKEFLRRLGESIKGVRVIE